MVSDGYTHWVILQVAGNALMSVAPVASMASVYVAPTVREAVAILSRGDVAAMPLVGDNLHDLRLALMRYRVVV
jgi:hypothetical protein